MCKKEICSEVINGIKKGVDSLIAVRGEIENAEIIKREAKLSGYIEGCIGARNIALGKVRKAELSECSCQKWIPTHIDYPEDRMECILSTESGSTRIATYSQCDMKFWDDSDDFLGIGHVVAWMPAPPPYKAGD